MAGPRGVTAGAPVGATLGMVDDEALDRIFGALAHPIRRALMSRLARGDGASVSELAQPFDVSLMAVSKHLTVMEEAGLVRREKDGRMRRCSLEPEPVDAAMAWLERHRAFWEDRLDALAEYLEGEPGSDASRDA